MEMQSKFARNMMAQKLMSENKDNPFNSRFFQPSDALPPTGQDRRSIKGFGYFLPVNVPKYSREDGKADLSDARFDTPQILKDAYSGIMKFGQAMRGELKPEEIQKLAFDTSLNVTGGTLLGSKLIKGAVPRDALAMGLFSGSKSVKSLDDIKNKYPNVDLSVSSKPEGITLSKIVVPESARSEGIGSNVMKDLIKYADENNLPIALTPDSSFGGSKTRLKSFYRKFGFKDNKGRNKDFSFRESMIRQPKQIERKDNVVKLDFQKKKIEAELDKKDVPRDTSSGHAADGVPTQFGPPAHNMNLQISEEFTPKGFGTFSTDVGKNYENLKFFISSSRGTPQFKEEVDFYRKLFAIKGNPDAEITVYRASPTNDLRPGDLVTPIKSDAKFLVDESKITQDDIIKSERQRRKDSETIDLREEKNLRTMENIMGMLPIKENTPSKLFEYKVKAKDIRWDGNNGLIRWGYFPDKS
jgi:GNAT superfamily N-acetyltransferase